MHGEPYHFGFVFCFCFLKQLNNKSELLQLCCIEVAATDQKLKLGFNAYITVKWGIFHTKTRFRLCNLLVTIEICLILL